MSTLIVIPARWGSTRFPGKALVPICGVPMVVRTYVNTAAQAPGREVVVATDDERIAAVCRDHKVPVAMTGNAHVCGTDRVAEVAFDRAEHDVVINVQGDEPAMAPGVVEAVEAEVLRSRSVVTGLAPIHDPAELQRTSVGKVTVGALGRVLWIDRVLLGGTAEGADHWTQVCCYGFLRDDLLEFARMGQGHYECRTGIELLRWIEAGYRLQGIRVPGGRHAVDEPEDVARVEEFIRSRRGGT